MRTLNRIRSNICTASCKRKKLSGCRSTRVVGENRSTEMRMRLIEDNVSSTLSRFTAAFSHHLAWVSTRLRGGRAAEVTIAAGWDRSACLSAVSYHLSGIDHEL